MIIATASVRNCLNCVRNCDDRSLVDAIVYKLPALVSVYCGNLTLINSYEVRNTK